MLYILERQKHETRGENTYTEPLKQLVKQKLLIPLFLILSSCWINSHSPAINKRYDFKNVSSINIDIIEDFLNAPRSGEMIFANLKHNFLKFDFDVNKSVVKIGNGKGQLLLSCVITEFTDSKMLVVPYRYEDRGYTKTVIKQLSGNYDEGKEKTSNQAQTSTITTHAGKINEGNKVEYSQCRVGVLIKLTDLSTGSLVWSHSYWYSGLEMQRTIELCLKNLVSQLDKLFR